jgi:hypothetical protein
MNKIALSLLLVLPVYGCDAGGRAEQPSQRQAQTKDVKSHESDGHENVTAVIQSCLAFLSDTTLSKSSSVPITGDLRPQWRVSGRVRNNCERDISEVTFFIVAFKKDSFEELDTTELTLKGAIAANSTRGIEENVQLRITLKDGAWAWNIYPTSGRLGPMQPQSDFQKF